MLFYNKTDFEKIGAQPPQSWGEIMALVPKFNAAGIAPFSLGGQSRWTNMMWLEFLFDRIGGPEVFQAVFDGEKDAWSQPGALEALTKVQELVKANGFVKGFSSITADSNADQALLYTGKAAMMLHGAWTYGSMASEGGDFVSGGHLGYMNFPPVEGGKGDPSNTVGNPGQYLSISSKASAEQKEIAKKFFATARARPRRRQGMGRHRRRCRSSRAATARSPRPRTPSSSSSSTTRQQRQELRAVLGPGAEPDGGGEAAGQHRQAVPVVDLAAAVRRQHEPGHRQ